MTQTSVPLAGVLVERFGPGEVVPHPQPGDFILTHGDAFYSKLIHIGQRLRFRGEDRKYTYWDHAAIIIAENGDLIVWLADNWLYRVWTAHRWAADLWLRWGADLFRSGGASNEAHICHF